MALLPDLAIAAIYAVVVFLVVLGFLVVFVEAIRPSRVIVSLVIGAGVASALGWAGEAGLGLLAVATAGAVIASRGFERLTSR